MKYCLTLILLMLLISIKASGLTAAVSDFFDDDNDGLLNFQETLIFKTDPNDNDSDDDGFSDGHEILKGYSPRIKAVKLIEADSDNDGLNDDWEIKIGTDLTKKDSDGDGYGDWEEIYNGYSPLKKEPLKVEKKILINIKSYSLKYYFGDIELGNFLVSTGKKSTPTPKGDFMILAKVPVKNYYGYPNTKWNLHFATNHNSLRYYIHGAYWHDKFGIANVSGGCVNVPYSEMERLYNWANKGTKVVIK